MGYDWIRFQVQFYCELNNSQRKKLNNEIKFIIFTLRLILFHYGQSSPFSYQGALIFSTF